MNVRDGEDELVQELTSAIHAGDIQTAQNIVVQLTNLHLKLNIDIVQEQKDSAVEKPFKITVQVEDRESAGASFDLLVRSTDKIIDLKRRVYFNFKFPVEVQRWIIGQRIQDDKSTLAKCHVRSPTTVFLYLLPARYVGLKRQSSSHEEYAEGAHGFANMVGSINAVHNASCIINEEINDIKHRYSLLSGAEDFLYPIETEEAEDFERNDKELISSWKCPVCTYDNTPADQACSACRSDRDMTASNIDSEETEAVGGAVIEEKSDVLKVGDRVVWHKNFTEQEAGTVRWIGILPDVEGNQVHAGVEFDNKVGNGTGKYGDQQLFYAEQDHASLVPVLGLIRES